MPPFSLPADFPRPEQHPYDPDPLNRGQTCATCGFGWSFGGLHPATEVPDLPVPSFCARCEHAPHAAPCRWTRPVFRGRAVCGCTEVAEPERFDMSGSTPGAER